MSPSRGPEILARAYRDYHRYGMTVASGDQRPVTQERDVLMAGKVVAGDSGRHRAPEIVMIRQFRLPAHLANGRGDLVEFVAGRVEAGETLAEAASRECKEEIGVAPAKLVELLTYLSTPGVTDEEVTVFLAAVDTAQVREGPLVSPDGEQLYRPSGIDRRGALRRSIASDARRPAGASDCSGWRSIAIAWPNCSAKARA